MRTYEIVRFWIDGAEEIQETGVTLEEAQAHCRRDDTQGGVWFVDGYRRED